MEFQGRTSPPSEADASSGSTAVVAAAPLPRRRRRWKRLLAVLIGVYAFWLLLVFLGQPFIIYLGAYRGRPDADGPADPRVQQVWLKPQPDVALEGWFLVGDGRSGDAPGPAILFFHGNKHHIDDVFRFATPYVAAGYSFLAIDYRGFGRSTGTPNDRVLGPDGVAWFDWLARRPMVATDAIILHANSLGGAVALEVATERPPRAIILESTFTRLRDLYPRLGVPAFLCTQEFDNARLIAGIQAPLLIDHGSNDWIIPAEHGRRLAALAPNAEFVLTEAGHTNYEPAWPAIRDFLTRLGLPAPR